jgi:hypothetical protein
MPRFFHGTDRAFATAMSGPPAGPGTIDVTRGGGEFGQGFYTQDSVSNALTWVQHRPNMPNPCVLEVDIDDALYQALNPKQLDYKKAKRLEQKIRSAGTQNTHVLGENVVVGPLNGSNWIEQQKFETQASETLLNGNDTNRRVI